jgi:hypothetical protein
VGCTTVCCKGAASKGEPAAFAVKFYGYSNQVSVPKKLRVFICRCGRLVSHGKVPMETAIRGRAAKKGHSMRTPYARRRRSHGFQGRPVLCSELRTELFQWFLCIRKAIKGRVWGRHVIRAAERIRKRLVKHYLDRKLNVPRMPKIRPGWIWAWARDFNICMRKPNRRYKVSRAKIKSGLAISWKNIYRARLCFRLLYGETRRSKGLSDDPVTSHVDQKPLHFNEGDSKDLATLDLAGETDIILKTNVSASRSRLTCNTMVTHPKPPSPAPGIPYVDPVEILFKLKTDRCIKGLRIPGDVPMSVWYSESGSYNEEAFLNYLQRHLPELTPERIADGDYRVLALDAFEVHKTAKVIAFANSRGYIVIGHRGGTTAIGQWNDTDLHLPMEKEYLNLETLDFDAQLTQRPWRVPSRSRQSIINDIACVWASLPHEHIGRKASKLTGWGIALPSMRGDGTFEHHAPEDSCVGREAKIFFDEVDMPRARAEDLEIVLRAFQEGKIQSWNDVQALMLPFESDDIQVQGQELLDGEIGDDDAPWNDNDPLDSKADVMQAPVEAAPADSKAAPGQPAAGSGSGVKLFVETPSVTEKACCGPLSAQTVFRTALHVVLSFRN